ncbi:trissin receptor [Plakobranchus ocellatus]|uniref:Trissin receptor n=1 Tax=Plakobranchus ocellatus TaxID=259542 RepID=A0AAV4ABW3_9GAST|nr:trissin receptor [Plakobranchus ocellatus]
MGITKHQNGVWISIALGNVLVHYKKKSLEFANRLLTPCCVCGSDLSYPICILGDASRVNLYLLLCSGCLSNSLVLYTIGRNKRMRTRTNFFLANLAGADLAVGVICVLPKLSTYLSPTWLLGEVSTSLVIL